LCTVLIQNPNFLILDEPTNDLDIVTLNVLESFLLDFPGCLMVVSHDRYFMDKIIDHLFVFRGNAVIENFPGNYSDFRAYEDSQVTEKRAQKEVATSDSSSKKTWKKESTSNKLSYADQKEYKQLERDIQKLENKKTKAQNAFTNPELSGEDIAELSKKLQEINTAIETKTERWFVLSAMLEN